MNFRAQCFVNANQADTRPKQKLKARQTFGPTLTSETCQACKVVEQCGSRESKQAVHDASVSNSDRRSHCRACNNVMLRLQARQTHAFTEEALPSEAAPATTAQAPLTRQHCSQAPPPKCLGQAATAARQAWPSSRGSSHPWQHVSPATKDSK